MTGGRAMSEHTNAFMSRDPDATPDEDRRMDEADPAEIRADIRETRERMGDTLEQLGERLNPGHLKEQVKQDIRDATIGKVEHMAQSAADQMDDARQTINEARRTITDTIRENPIPAAMAGVGLGWLIYNATQQGTSGTLRSSRRGERARGGRAMRGYAGAGYIERGSRQEGSDVDEPDTIDRVRQRASELAGNVEDTASEVAGRAQDMAENVADQTRYQARRVEDQFYETPLAVGAAALALGMVAGLAIPETRKESEVMGSARDRLVHKVRDVAEETKDKVERVVDQAQHTAKEAARQEGLTTS